MDDAAPPPRLPTLSREPQRESRRGWLLLIAAALLVTLLIALMAAAWWSLRTERGSAWLLAALPGVQVEGTKGALLGGDFDAQRIVIHLPGAGDSLALTGVGWRGARIERAAAPLWCRVAVDSLFAERVDLTLAPNATANPPTLPHDLRLPVEIELRALRIGELHANALGDRPVRELAARVHFGAGGGTEHRIEQLTFGWDRLRASAQVRIAADAPMALGAALGLAQQDGGALPPWSAAASLTGPLAAPTLQATLRAAPAPDRPAKTLDARATLRPFARWPLADLQASAKALDLSAFSSAAPATSLTAQATATSTAADQPASISIDLTNDIAGRWNEGRLPLRHMTLEVAGRPDQPEALELRTLDAELGTPRASAGHVSAKGRWTRDRWSVSAALNALQPALLDTRAPAMQWSGPLALSSSALAGGGVDIKAELAGQVADRGAARAVQLRLDAGVSAQRVQIRELQASAGGARLSLAGLVTHAANDAPWGVKAGATLVEFDPATWWPGRDDSPWRKAKTRLNASAKVDLNLPASAARGPLLDALAALRGEAAVMIDKSLLCGVPLRGEAALRSTAGAQAIATLMLDADGNRLRAEGRVSPPAPPEGEHRSARHEGSPASAATNGASDTWDVSVDAAALNRLAPVFKLYQSANADATLAGTLSANAHVSGRWPALATTGTLEANALRVGAYSVQAARARWALGTSATAPVEAQATLTQASVIDAAAAGPGLSLESVQLQLKGNGRAHTLDVRAESKSRPPAWAEAAVAGGAVPPASSAGNVRTLAVLQAQGGIVDVPDVALAGWRGVIRELEVRGSTPGAAPLLRTRDVALEALWSGGAPRASVQPGRAEILGGALRWKRITWQAASAPDALAQIEAEAELEPLRIAPLLARAQPDFGWGGDLSVAGHLQVHTSATPAPGFSAEIVIERSAGDLSVTDEIGTRALGLTDLRLGLSAANGVWNFTQGVAGTSLGVFAGAVVARTSPQATWPAADVPIQGVLELRVAELGSWGTWVPPGWRLGGALHSSASIGGRFGAPEYVGTVEGTQLSVRNFLQGVNVHDGDVAIRLQGSTARIERFTAKGGDGGISVTGTASLGEAPQATLTLSADKFALLGRVDRRIVASGTGQLQIDRKTLAFDGRFNVDEGLIDFTRSDAPALSDDVQVVRARGVPSPAAAASAAASPVASVAPARNVALDLRVTLGEQLRVKGRGLDTGLRGELHITSPGGPLAVNGTVRAADGTYAAYGQKLVIDRGLIAFSGAVENPRLDIEATRPNLDTRVGVIISGSAANPRVRLFSEPELSEIDKLSWLVMGRASDGLGRTDTALLQRAALALLAGEGGGPTDQITKALGLDEISLRQTDGEVRETVIALGKQLSQRWYVGYERGLNATTGSFQLIYRIAQRFTLRAQSGDDNALDLIWTWRWQ